MKPAHKHKGKALWLSVASATPVRTPHPRKKEKRLKSPVVRQRKPIRKRSVKMETKMREYHRKRRAFLKGNPVCAASICRKPATEVHHRVGRVGDLLTDEKHFVGLCPFHHRKVHSDLLWARNEGLIAEKGQWLNLNKKEKLP